MEEYVDLAKMSDVFDNKTLRYRINGFAHACRMENVGVVRNGGVIFNTVDEKSTNPHYFISVTENENKGNNSVTLRGQYDDLFFTFVNYYQKQNLNRKVVEIPFSISLEKKIDKDNYHFEIKTINGMETEFTITKSRETKNSTIAYNVHFYSNVLNFSKVLKLVKSFAYNPELVFMTYRETMSQKKVTFTNNELDRAVMQDVNLDKPVGKIKKIINNIIK